jgi:zinc protease
MSRVSIAGVYRLVCLAMVWLIFGCGSAATQAACGPTASLHQEKPGEKQTEAPPQKQQPPASGAARDIRFPAIADARTKSGLPIHVVQLPELPVVQIELIIRSGSADDPADLPGLAQLVSGMLKEGTTRRSAAELAETVDFLGASLSVVNGQECIYLKMHAVSDHFSDALSIVAEIAMRPSFSVKELVKLKRRELDRLAMRLQNPYFLAARELFKGLYGAHPYARIDATAEAIKKVKRQQLWNWHDIHFAPNNALLLVAGDVSVEAAQAAAERAFAGWRSRTIPETVYADPPARKQRSVVLVDRPQSVQSFISVGNLALERANPDYIALLVANQILGGSAASRLFMELREKRGLTYGAYSRLSEKVKVAPISAEVAVRTAGTAEAIGAMMAQLEQLVSQPTPQSELDDAKRFLADTFPLTIDTAQKITELVADLYIFGLPEGYWDSYRSKVISITPSDAYHAAQRYIRPNEALIVAVGRAAEIKAALAKYGPVTVVDTNGAVIPQSDNTSPTKQ